MRHALALGLDRATAAKAIFGKYAALASSPAAPAAWFGGLAPSPVEFDPKRASRILCGRGWKDSDGDGVLDRNGVALSFTLLVPSSSESRKQLALIVQEQCKRLGVRVEVVPLEVTQFFARRASGKFRRQPWRATGASRRRGACSTAGDVAHRPTTDSTATGPPTRSSAPRTWPSATRHRPSAPGCAPLAADYPAVFLFAADRVYAMPKVLRQRLIPGRVSLAAGVDVDAGRHGPLR